LDPGSCRTRLRRHHRSLALQGPARLRQPTSSFRPGQQGSDQLLQLLYGGLGVGEVRRLKQFEEENRKLKSLVADLLLDRAMLQDVVAKKL
jgi:hypothetical protein